MIGDMDGSVPVCLQHVLVVGADQVGDLVIELFEQLLFLGRQVDAGAAEVLVEALQMFLGRRSEGQLVNLFVEGLHPFEESPIREDFPDEIGSHRPDRGDDLVDAGEPFGILVVVGDDRNRQHHPIEQLPCRGEPVESIGDRRRSGICDNRGDLGFVLRDRGLHRGDDVFGFEQIPAH
ncbi:hypothetical protein, partial [Nocardia cyriacigeorgica]|uniref:hypothetical protein n=1 Tax=Nocardia cyriacigeorgica TaxID=135487 RepID=UPI002455936A